MRDARLYALASSPWAIEPRKGKILLSVLEAHALGIERANPRGAAEERQVREAARASAPSAPATIAVLPLHGVLMPRGDFLSDGSGSVSLEGASSLFADFNASPAIDGILLDIDSPGGSVFGVEEFSDQIRAADKPVVALAWGMAASGAYWIASAADELVMTPSSIVGSIGVYEVHFDATGAYEKAGLKPTVIHAGKFKTELADTGPLSADALEFEQGQVDAYYTAFVTGVAAGRGVSPQTVMSSYGEGRVLMSGPALGAGMVDRIGSYEETVTRFSRDLSDKKRLAAQDQDRKRARARADVQWHSAAGSPRAKGAV